jgi:hypothetical protein
MHLHLDENQLKSYCDAQLSENEQPRVMAHLESCPYCRGRLQAMQAQMQLIGRRLDLLDPGSAPRILPAAAARARFAVRLSQKEKENVSMNRIFSRSLRPVWAALVLVIVVGLALSVPSVRAMAVNLLGIFRVQQITVIPIDQQSLSANLKDSNPGIQKLLSDSIQYQHNGTAKTVQNAAEASQAAGFSVRLPAAGPAALHEIKALPGANGTFTLDVPRINQILKEMNRSDLNLADNLDKSTITVEVPASVSTSYGTCAPAASQDASGPAEKRSMMPGSMPGADCTVFVQLPSPTVTTPEGLDLNKLGTAFLELSGMPADKAQSMSDKINWSNTLVIPLPVNASNYQDVSVDGVNGTLVEENAGRGGSHYVLLWVKNGILYGVSGSGDSAAAVQLANSLQ